MQRVKVRDATTDRQMEDGFAPEDQPIREALSAKLEGKTGRYPHPKGSLPQDLTRPRLARPPPVFGPKTGKD
jgi:hypothetical protein